MGFKEQNGRHAKLPPHSIEAEKAVLGSMLLNGNECVDAALEQLVPDDFYQPIHRDIFATMGRLASDGEAVDAVTVEQRMEQDGKLAAGTFEYLADLAHDVLAPGNISHYIRIVKEKSALRRVIDVCMKVSSDCYAGAEDAQTLLGRAGDVISRIALESTRGEVMPIRKAVVEAYKAMSVVMKNKGGLIGVRTGFPTMDQMLSGFQKDQLIVIAARPGMGKTSFATNIVHNASLSQQAVCLIFSLEMSAQQLVSRMLCSEAHVDMQKTRTGRLAGDDFMRLGDAMRTLSRAPIYIDDSASIIVTEMQAKARRLKRKAGLDMIVVDYLQLMRGSGKADNRTQEIAQITRALKIMSKDLEVPVVVLSQLSRQGEKEGSKYPKLSELRESGAIEQDADVVIFLQREDYLMENKTDETIGKARIIIAKQRNGPTGAIDVRWNGEYTRYMEADHAPQDVVC